MKKTKKKKKPLRLPVKVEIDLSSVLNDSLVDSNNSNWEIVAAGLLAALAAIDAESFDTLGHATLTEQVFDAVAQRMVASLWPIQGSAIRDALERQHADALAYCKEAEEFSVDDINMLRDIAKMTTQLADAYQANLDAYNAERTDE